MKESVHENTVFNNLIKSVESLHKEIKSCEEAITFFNRRRMEMLEADDYKAAHDAAETMFCWADTKCEKEKELNDIVNFLNEHMKPEFDAYKEANDYEK